jgi:Flp pilus assembly secretin CpaC
VDFAGGFVFPINTRKATTNVLVSNGSTIVIGGLLQSDERWSEQRIPWISKVPVLGSLFKSTSIGPEGKIELLIFLTPTIRGAACELARLGFRTVQGKTHPAGAFFLLGDKQPRYHRARVATCRRVDRKT